MKRAKLYPLLRLVAIAALLGVVSPLAPTTALADTTPPIVLTDQFGTGAEDRALGVAVDGEGNAFVVGYTGGVLPEQTSSGGMDAFIRKYSSDGNVLWLRQFGSAADDSANFVAADSAANAYVVGYTGGVFSGETSSGGIDAFIRKYDPLGNVLWTRQFGTSATDYANGVVVVGLGNVYVAGYTFGTLPGCTSSGGWDAFIRKYDSSGNVLWTRQFGSAADDAVRSATVDGAANIYVVGYTYGAFPGCTSSGGWDAFVRKYDSSGNVLWTRQFGSDANDWAREVATDRANNVYVAGYTLGTLPGATSSGGRDAFIRKYDPLGDVLWTRQFGTGTVEDIVGVASDGAGNIYVVGYTYGTLPGETSSGGWDAFVRKYDSLGNVLWTRQFGTSSVDVLVGVTLDGAGNMYVAGYTLGSLPGATSSGGWDAFVRKYDLEGGSPANVAGLRNMPPTIEESTLQIQISSAQGVAWGWKAGTKSGDRPAPYVFDGEKIHLEVDVSDTDSDPSLAGMRVNATLGSSIEIPGTLQWSTIDPVNKIARGHYSADLSVDAGIQQGKYDLVLTATNHRGATATHYPVMYQAALAMLMKPTVTLEISKSSVTFHPSQPGGHKFVAVQNPVNLRPQALVGAEHVPVLFSILQLGTDMQSPNGGVFRADEITWALTNQPSNATPLGVSEQTIAGTVREGQSIEVYYWLNVFSGHGAGAYSGTITYRALAR